MPVVLHEEPVERRVVADRQVAEVLFERLVRERVRTAARRVVGRGVGKRVEEPLATNAVVGDELGVNPRDWLAARKRLLAGVGSPGDRRLEFVIAEEGITAAAYIVMSAVGQTWEIEECGDRDETGARVGALLQALIAREPAESRPVIRGWLPPGFAPPQVTVVAASAPPRLWWRPLSSRAQGVQLSPADVLYWLDDLF